MVRFSRSFCNPPGGRFSSFTHNTNFSYFCQAKSSNFRYVAQYPISRFFGLASILRHFLPGCRLPGRDPRQIPTRPFFARSQNRPFCPQKPPFSDQIVDIIDDPHSRQTITCPRSSEICYTMSMSFSTNLANYSYSAVHPPCHACYDPDKTPETIFLCFAEIQIGALWIPADPPPPFGSYELTHDGACDWSSITPDYFLSYQSDALGTTLRVFGPIFQNVFQGVPAPPCENWFSNINAVPAGNKFFGGYCVVINTLPGGLSDITDLMQLMSESPDWADWLGSVPTAADTASYQFSKHQDHTNVRILMDVP